ncbi:hypothetical protein [Acinetobacter nosocomialis]|uniref:hypothetical protein n=1 Tax=Acinetobacter nosocomialis TaxID=106654 RepID=UPI00125EC34F|nr:hypothetical protein [Acinetobacter nosocomialis]
MTDLNKEREAFEKLSEIAEILNEEKSHFNGDFYDLPFNSCAESFINGAWYAWQEKAKAQAVPEGYVVVPRVPTENMLIAGCSSISYGMTNEKNSERIFIAMVKASESGDEG